MCQHGEMRRSGKRRKQERLLQRKNQNAKNWFWLFEEGGKLFRFLFSWAFPQNTPCKKSSMKGYDTINCRQLQ